MKKSILMVLAIVLVATAVPALAHQWGCWIQPDSSVYVRNAAALSSQAQAALNEWNAETCLYVPTVSYHTEVSVFDGYYGSTGWGGIASVESNSGCNITHCHARVNRSYSYSSNGYRGIFCQEVGHCFGLDHSNDGGCMGGGYYYSISSGTGYTVVSHNTSDIASMYGCSSAQSPATPAELDFSVEDHHDSGRVAREELFNRPMAHAFWVNQPRSVAETIELSSAVVIARVANVWAGEDLVVPVEGLNEANENRVPTQRVQFDVENVLHGEIDGSFELFHTGNSDFVLEGDPPYQVGQLYVLFVQPREGDTNYLAVSPEGRYDVMDNGLLLPASEKDFAQVYSRLPLQEMVRYVADYREATGTE